MVQSTPGMVDVNVHPRKSEVKFADPGKMYEIVFHTVQKALSENKVATNSTFSSSPIASFNDKNSNIPITNNQYTSGQNINNESLFTANDIDPFIHKQRTFDHDETPQFRNQEIGSYSIVGQIRNRYIILQSDDAVFYIDQHALAERVAYEKMKKNISDGIDLHPELLLQPLTIEIHAMPNIQEKIDQANALGFDCALL